MRIYFVRHGETYLNKYKKMQGWSDAPLTPEGELIAYQTGERLQEVPFSAIYTSDLGRTIQTAKIILSKNQHCNSEEIQPMKEFRETFFGSFEASIGKEVYLQIASKYGIELKDVFGKLSLADISNTMNELDPFDDAELANQFEERLADGIKKVITNHGKNEEVLVVTHGNVIRHLINKISPETNVFQEIGNSSVTIVEYQENELKLIEFNS